MGEIKNKTAGTVKSTAGRVTGNRKLEARGEGQKKVGLLQEIGRKLTGAVEEGIGKVTMDHKEEAKGRARRV